MKKAIGMFAALILALGMTGVAFAHWSEILYINGSVSTGEVDVEISNWDFEYYEDKVVAEVGITPLDLDGDGDTDKLEIILGNLYPSFSGILWITVHNNGSIPVNAGEPVLDVVSDPNGLEPFLDIDCGIVEAPGYFPQLDPCNTAVIGIYIHVLQEVEIGGEIVECPELATLTFHGYCEFVQWNA